MEFASYAVKPQKKSQNNYIYPAVSGFIGDSI